MMLPLEPGSAAFGCSDVLTRSGRTRLGLVREAIDPTSDKKKEKEKKEKKKKRDFHNKSRCLVSACARHMSRCVISRIKYSWMES